MTNNNRDEELEIIRQLLIATASRTESNSEKIDQVTEKLDRQTENLDQVTEKLDRQTENLDQVTEKLDRQTENLDRLGVRVESNSIAIGELRDAISELTINMNQLTARGDADHVVIMAMLEEVVELRQENRRILDYLFGQQRNGNGDQPTP